MKFSYAGFDRAGARVTGLIEAASSAEAQETLRGRGIYVAELGEQRAEAQAVGVRSVRGGSKKLVAEMCRQLSILVSTGTPLIDALHSLERQAQSTPWRAVIADLRAKVEEGQMLSEAMARHPGYFDAVCRSLVAAGEGSGRLDQLLERLSRLIRQQIKIRSAVRGALIYPVSLTAISGVVLVLMLIFVLPKFKDMFDTLGAALPPTTQALIAASTFFRSYWPGVIAGVAAASGGAWWWCRSASGRAVIDELLVTAPIVGRITRALATARVARVLGVLVEARVGLVDALKLVRQSSSNMLYVRLVERAEQAVVRGESVAAALSTAPGGGPELISHTVCESIRSGERSGRLGHVLVTVADALDEDNEQVLKSLSSVLEPLILVVLGVMVGAVAISMFLPLFDLAAATQPPGAGGGGP